MRYTYKYEYNYNLEIKNTFGKLISINIVLNNVTVDCNNSCQSTISLTELSPARHSRVSF